jgi:hypothetical protein
MARRRRRDFWQRDSVTGNHFSLFLAWLVRIQLDYRQQQRARCLSAATCSSCRRRSSKPAPATQWMESGASQPPTRAICVVAQ